MMHVEDNMVHQGMFSTLGGYHEYTGVDIMSTLGWIS